MALSPQDYSRPGFQEPDTSFALLIKLRIVLAVLNLPLAYFSNLSPYEANWPLIHGMAACGAFLAWMIMAYAIIQHPGSSERKNTIVSVLDVLAAVALVTATGGAASPFGSWISFVALGTVLVSRRRYALMIGVLAVSAHLVLGTVANEGHPISSLTLVRAVWAGTFALFGYLIRSSQTRHLRLLGGIERFSAEIGPLSDASQMIELFRRAIEMTVEPSNIVIRLEVLGIQTRPRLESGPGWSCVTIASGGHDFGQAHIARRRKFATDERVALQLLGERLASGLQRIQSNVETVDEAVRQERLALADEIHDTTIQTLTALDLGATMLQRLVAGDQQAWELAGEIGDQARGHIAHVRRFIRGSVSERIPGPESLTALLEERWAGRYEFHIEPGTRLSEACWRLVGLMVREGLNNALKHGRSTYVRLVVSSCNDGFEARLEANGEPPPDDVRPGYGLTRLRAVAAAQWAVVELIPGRKGGSVLVVRSSGENLP